MVVDEGILSGPYYSRELTPLIRPLAISSTEETRKAVHVNWITTVAEPPMP